MSKQYQIVLDVETIRAHCKAEYGSAVEGSIVFIDANRVNDSGDPLKLGDIHLNRSGCRAFCWVNREKAGLPEDQDEYPIEPMHESIPDAIACVRRALECKGWKEVPLSHGEEE